MRSHFSIAVLPRQKMSHASSDPEGKMLGGSGTALMLAAGSGQIEVVNMLLEAGADVALKSSCVMPFLDTRQLYIYIELRDILIPYNRIHYTFLTQLTNHNSLASLILISTYSHPSLKHAERAELQPNLPYQRGLKT